MRIGFFPGVYRDLQDIFQGRERTVVSPMGIIAQGIEAIIEIQYEVRPGGFGDFQEPARSVSFLTIGFIAEGNEQDIGIFSLKRIFEGG